MLLDASLDSLGVGAYDLLKLFAALEEHECGHGPDAEFLCDVWNLVDVEFVEAGVRV